MDIFLIYLQILAANFEGNVWQSVGRFDIWNLGVFVKGKDLVKNFVDPFTSFEAVLIGVCDILSSQQRT